MPGPPGFAECRDACWIDAGPIRSVLGRFGDFWRIVRFTFCSFRSFWESGA